MPLLGDIGSLAKLYLGDSEGDIPEDAEAAVGEIVARRYLQAVALACQINPCDSGLPNDVPRCGSQWGIDFSTAVAESRVGGAGLGLFLTGGACEPGSVVAGYPGVIYSPEDLMAIYPRV